MHDKKTIDHDHVGRKSVRFREHAGVHVPAIGAIFAVFIIERLKRKILENRDP